MKIKKSLEHQLCQAATRGSVEDVKLIMLQDVDLNARNAEGKTPLHLAVHSGNTAVTVLLVEMGALVNARDKEKRTPLHIACLNNHREIGRCLIEEGGAEMDLKDQGMKVPMHLACINGHTRVVDLLVRFKAMLETPTKEILQPLHLAVLGNHCYITTLLINARAGINTISGKDSEAPLHYATKFGHLEATELLLKMLANVNIRDSHGIAPLHHAAHYDHVGVLNLLLRANSDPYATTKDSLTALEMALRVGNFDAAVTLHMCYRRDGRDHDFRMLTQEQGATATELLRAEEDDMMRRDQESYKTPLDNGKASQFNTGADISTSGQSF